MAFPVSDENSSVSPSEPEEVEDLRETARLLHQLIAELPAAIYTTDADGVITFCNEAAVELWGCRPELGKDRWCGSWRIYDADGNPIKLHECPMAITLREGRPVRGVTIIVEAPDGSRRQVLPHPTPLRDASGKLIGAVNMLIDIGDRIAAEKASRHLAAIVESSDDAIVSKNLDGVIMSWNRGAQRLFGYTEQEVLGKPVTIFIPPDRMAEEATILGCIRKGIPIDHFETIRQRKDGSLVPISLTVSPIKDAQGRIVGASKIAREISEQLRTQQELKRARDDAQAASLAKDRFFATLSHELRTPLNPVVLTASDALSNPNLTEDVRADFEMILRNVSLEARLIDDMLDLTKISRGKLDLNFGPVVLESIMRDALRTIAADVAEKKIELRLQFEAGDCGTVGDPVRLQQVFWNVLRNAVKFTLEGGRVEVTTRADHARRLFVAEITDAGIGMKPEELNGVFEPFSQGDHARSDHPGKFGGLGLGLAISQQIAGLHAGRIVARSPGPGMGSTFTIELPIRNTPNVGMVRADDAGHAAEPGEKAGATNSTTSDEPGLSVLLVDDHQPTCFALSRFLTRRGHRVLAAESVRQARKIAETEGIDVLISDIGLPDGSGYDLMKELRRQHPDLQGIAVSGYGMADDRERSRQAGFFEHCTKPINVTELHEILARIRTRPG